MKTSFALALCFLLASAVTAMPPLDGGPEPVWPEGVNQPDRIALSRDKACYEGEWRLLILLVDFDDYPWDNQDDPWFENDGAPYTQNHFRNMLFSENSFAHPHSVSQYTGSMRDYYNEVSGGQFTVTGTVTGWYRATEDYSYYVGNRHGTGQYPNNSQGLVEDIVGIADEDIDFSEFDNDGDGVVDALVVVHAGPGSEELPAEERERYIWSHMWSLLEELDVDDVSISSYNMDPQTGTIGVFCHEFGHTLGLPDLYDIDGSSEGIGEWGLMGSGGWCSRPADPRGTCPSHFCGWSKNFLDWVDVVEVDRALSDVRIPPIETSGTLFRLWTAGAGDSPEYFYVENRRRIGFDAGLLRRQIENELPAPEGLLITHIDERQANQGNQENSDDKHRLVDVEEASIVWMDEAPFEQLDGVRGGSALNLYTPNRGDNGDLWPGFAATTRDSTDWQGERSRDRFGIPTIPSSRSYDGPPSLVEVCNITLDGADVVVDFSVDRPDYPLPLPGELTVDDEEGGNGSGTADPGETFDLWISLTNYGQQDTPPIIGVLTTESRHAAVNEGESGYGILRAGESAVNEKPFEVEISLEAGLSLLFQLTLIMENLPDLQYPIILSLRPNHEWFKHPRNPVLRGEDESWDRDVFSPAVVVEGDTLVCWYVGGNTDINQPFLSAVGRAWSMDGGVSWSRSENPVLLPQNVEWAGGGIQGIGVYHWQNIYLMLFSATRIDDEENISIGQATSRDGMNWEIAQDPILVPDGDIFTQFVTGPLTAHPFPPYPMGCLLNAKAQFGGFEFNLIVAAVTQDLQNWSIEPNLIIPPSMDEERFDAWATMAPDAVGIPDRQRYSVLYTGVANDSIGRLGILETDGQSLDYHQGMEALGSVLEPGGEYGWEGEDFLLGGRQFQWQGEPRLLYSGVSADHSRAAVGLAVAHRIMNAPTLPPVAAVQPRVIMLDPAFPNPFNSRMSLRYHLAQPGVVSVSVFTITGREVQRLYHGYQRPGEYRVNWDGLNRFGKPAATGTYIISVHLGKTSSASRRVLLLK